VIYNFNYVQTRCVPVTKAAPGLETIHEVESSNSVQEYRFSDGKIARILCLSSDGVTSLSTLITLLLLVAEQTLAARKCQGRPKCHSCMSEINCNQQNRLRH
jgi:hypothetical protein